MATVTVLRRATGKAHTISVLETDQAILGGLVRSTAGAGALYDDAFTTSVTLGGGAAVATVTVGGAATTALNLGTGMGSGDTINIGGGGSVTKIAGDLVVQGTATSVDSEIVNMADNHLFLNAGYTTAAAQTGGLVVNYLPTATATTVAATGFVAGVPATSNPTVKTVGTATFAANDFIQISGAANTENNGLFEVLTHVGTTLTIRGVGTSATVQDFSQNQFVADTTVAGAITKVTVSVIRSGTDGIWETAAGTTNAITFSDLSSSTGTTLQVAYDNSTSPATITTNATDDEILITGTAGLRVTGTGADNTVSAGFGFEVDTTGAFRLLGDAASTISVDTNGLTLSTTTGGTLSLTSAAAISASAATAITVNSTGGSIGIGNNADAQAINVGTGAAARTITIGNSTGATAAAINVGTGALDLGTNAIAHTVNVGSATGASAVNVNTGTGGVNVATNAVAATVTIGNATGASSTVVDVGTGNLDLGITATVHTVRIGSATGASAVTMNTGTGGITIGTNAVAATVAIGNATGASAVTITSGTGEVGVTATGATSDINFTARSGTTIQLNESGQESLVGTFAATSIVGALNELKTGASTFSVSDFYTTTGRTIGEPVRATAGSRIATSATDATVLATSEGFVGLVKIVGAAGTGQVTTNGRGVALFEAGIATPVSGEPIYLSETTGRVTNVAPSGNPASNKIVFQIGVMIDNTSASGGTGLTAGTVGAAETAAILLQPMQLFEL